MTPTEIERLVVKMEADNSAYIDGLKASEAQTLATQKALTELTKQGEAERDKIWRSHVTGQKDRYTGKEGGGPRGMSEEEQERLNARMNQLAAAEILMQRRHDKEVAAEAEQMRADKLAAEEQAIRDEAALQNKRDANKVARFAEAREVIRREYEVEQQLAKDAFVKKLALDAENGHKEEVVKQQMRDKAEAMHQSFNRLRNERGGRQAREDAEKRRRQDREMNEGPESGGEWGYGMRAMSRRRIAGAAVQFGVAQTAEQEAAAAGHALMGMGAMFGTTGMIVAATIDVIMSKVDRVVAAGNKGFLSMLDGVKSLEKGLSHVGFETLKSEIDIVVGKMNPTTNWGKLFRGTKILGQDIAEHVSGKKSTQDKRDLNSVQEALDKAMLAQKQFSSWMESAPGKKTLKAAASSHAEELGATFRQTGAEAGKLAFQVQAYQLALQGASKEEVNYVLLMGRHAEAMSNLGQQYTGLFKKSRDFMLGPGEAAINEAEEAAHKTGDRPRFEKLAKETREKREELQFKELAKGSGAYRMMMEGRSKADLAWYNTAQDGMSKYQAKVSTAMGDVMGQIQSNTVKTNSFMLTQGEATARQLERDAAGLVGQEHKDAIDAVAALRAGDLKVQKQEMELAAIGWEATAARKSKAEVARLQAAKGSQADYNAFVKASMAEVEGQVSSGNRKVLDFMLTATEAANRQLRRDMPGMTPVDRERANRLIETNQNNERISQMQELTKELTSYAMAMEHASAAEMARAMATEGGINKQMAYEVSLLKQASQATEQYMLPQDKYMKEQQRLTVLLKEKLITEQTYNRALGAAQAGLFGKTSPAQQAGLGSAEAAGRLEAQRNWTRPVQQLMLDTGERANNNQTAKGARERTNDLLQQIKDLIAADKEKDKNKPNIKINQPGQGANPP